MPRLAAVSIDLDEIPCYCAIYGLPPPPAQARWVVYERAVPRFVTLLAQLQVRATFFVIGSDLSEPRIARIVADLHAAGHEIANHTLDHDYAFSRLRGIELRRQVTAASDAIEAATGARPAGFRAPGYTMSNAVVDVLTEVGMAYDSSVFPCPGYYAAKAAAIGAISLAGRRSRSIVDDPRVLGAPTNPYRMGKPYYRRGSGLLELPIGVTRSSTGRLPYLGTTLALAGPAGSRILSHAMRGRPLVNLELHGIDLAGVEEDGLQFLAQHQRDLRRPLESKWAAFEAAVATLRENDYQFDTLERCAQRLC